MSEEKRDLKIKLIDDKGKYYEVISTEQFNIQEELNKEIEINIKYREVLDKIKEYITTRTPSDIGISGNKPKKYYTLSEDEVDYILELLEEIE